MRCMNDPSKHHYIPAFYLRQWATNGFVCEMRKIRGKVVAKPKAPDATGFLKDLYKIDGVPKEIAQHMELKFMHMVDTDAADALKRIQTNIQGAWPIRQRDGWIRFILSLLFRNPEVVAIIKAHFKTVWAEGISTLREDYKKTRKPGDPETFDDFLAKTDPHAPAVAASNFMQTIMNSEVTGNAIRKMTWGRLNLAHSKYTLLTSDRPIDMPISLQSKDAYITLPIGPKLVFVASNDDAILRTLKTTDHSDVARKMNERVVAQARQYVWGLDASALAFVKKRICTLPDREIVSDNARQQSLADARGVQTPQDAV
jgi:hypothetical protein